MAALMNLEGAAGRDIDPDAEAAGLFHRRIEFHVARKPFSGFGNNSNNGFKLVTLNPSSERQKTSGSGKTCENAELSDIGLDPELSFTITFRRIGAGLRNLGNTCFLNSVLQCLTYTEPLAAYLQSGKHQYSCRKAGFCALCAIQKHVSRALQSTGRILEPKDLVSNLRCISRSFRNARQEDAHEYMVNLLESMHKCCLPSGVPSESPSAYEKSLVHKIFGGHLRSQVKCMQCSFCSNKFDPFLDLSLEIVKAESLYKALTHFTAKEQLDGGTKHYQCQQCNQKVRALKQLTIHKAPHVLTIHLKRFGSHISGQKIDKNVAFAPTLDLKPFVTGPYDGDLKYTLYGVLVHAGWSTHSGHYYCFVRTSSGMWYSLDDNQVIQVSEKKVLQQKAYMLFYVRDRKNFVAKKQMDVGLNENMVMNAIRNGTYSKFNLESKQKMQNASIASSSSAAKSDRDESVATAPEEIPSKKMPFQNLNAKADDLQSKEAVPPSMKGLSKICSTPTTDIICHQAEPGLTVNVSGNTTLAEGFSVVQEMALPHCNRGLDSLTNKESSVVATPTSCFKAGANKDQSELACQPQNITSSKEACDVDGISSEMVRGSAGKRVDSTMVETHESTLTVTDLHSTEFFSSGIVKSKRPQLKVRRKLFKLQVTSMQLSSSMIFGGAKKKNKRRRHNSLQMKKSPNLRDLLSETDISYPQSSASNKPPVSTDHCTHSKRKKSEDRAHDKDKSLKIINGNGIGSSDSIKDGPGQKVGPSATKVSKEEPIAVGQFVARDPRTSVNHQSDLRQTGMTGIGARGLEEPTVGRWDGIDNSFSATVEAGAENAQIGYTGDEWDEEYDRGKRKKIRDSKISFGGPNLFQEFATRNAKGKKVKLNRSRSENHPFRIL